MKLEELPDDIARMLATELPDQALCRLRQCSTFFARAPAYKDEALRRAWIAQIRQYQVIPEQVIKHCLAWQTPEELKQFNQLLGLVFRELKGLLNVLPHAQWMVYALMNQPVNMAKAMHLIGPHPLYQPYHFYALAGHWEAFLQSWINAPQSWTDASRMQVARWAMCGGHTDFLNRLSQELNFPQTHTDAYYCEMLLFDAIASGHLDQVKILVPQLLRLKNPGVWTKPPILDIKFALHAAKNGQFSVYRWLINAKMHRCQLTETQHAAIVMFAAAEHDNLELVRDFLENPAHKKWGLTLNFVYQDKDACLLALYGGAVKVIRYIQATQPELLQRLNTIEQCPALHIAASNGKTELCKILVTECKQDPLGKDANGACASHHAAKSGHWPCYLSQGTALVENTDGETQLHYAAKRGEYWFLNKALTYYGVEHLQLSTKNGNSLLHYALQSMQIYLVKWLVEEVGLSLTVKNLDGNTALHTLVMTHTTEHMWPFILDILDLFGSELLFAENNEGVSVLALVPTQFKVLFNQHLEQGCPRLTIDPQ
jgi:hypothetical protein